MNHFLLCLLVQSLAQAIQEHWAAAEKPGRSHPLHPRLQPCASPVPLALASALRPAHLDAKRQIAHRAARVDAGRDRKDADELGQGWR